MTIQDIIQFKLFLFLYHFEESYDQTKEEEYTLKSKLKS